MVVPPSTAEMPPFNSPPLKSTKFLLSVITLPSESRPASSRLLPRIETAVDARGEALREREEEVVYGSEEEEVTAHFGSLKGFAL